MHFDSRLILVIAIVLMILGVVLPFLMVIHVLESTLPLNFFSFIASVSGLIFGIVGVAYYARQRRK